MVDAWTSTLSHIRTSSLDAVRSGLSALYGNSTFHPEGEFEWNAVVSTMGPLTVIQGALDTVAELQVTAQRHTLLVTRANSMQFSSAKGLGATIPGVQAAMFSPGTRTALKSDPAMRTSNLVFDPKFLEGQFAALTGEEIQGDIDFENALALDTPLGAYVNGLCYYLGESMTTGTRSMHPALVSNLVEGLSRALLFSQPHNRSHLLEAPAPPSSRTVVRMVEEYIDGHAGGPIVATDLARVTGTSVQSIESAFLEFRQTSPTSFIRKRRLERARQLLLETPPVSIAQAAQTAGYLRIESFDAAYFKAFHETPLQTRHRGFVGGASPSSAPMPQTPANRLDLLSDREREVSGLVARGLLNKQIAAELGISERTVQKHREQAMKKLGLNSAADLVRLWERAGK